ncbi:hypothetical protein ACE1ET_15560 [Saccharicrinis sp. FJH62]
MVNSKAGEVDGVEETDGIDISAVQWERNIQKAYWWFRTDTIMTGEKK